MNHPRHPVALRLVHWLMAPLLIAMLLIGVGMVSTVSSWHTTLISLHKPLGVCLLVLSLTRIAVKLRGPRIHAPDLSLPARLASGAVHGALYACMIAMPLIGWAMLSAGGFAPVSVLGVNLPTLIAPNVVIYAWLRALHTYVGELFYLCIAAHILAALVHGFVLRDGVLEAMSLRPRKRQP